jgi:hypothetical protein
MLQFERFEAVAGVLERASADHGVVILLDDLQWADETSLELLGFLARRVEHGLLVVGTVRQLDVGRNDAVTDALAVIARRNGSRRVTLRGLNADATTAVAAGASGMTLTPAVAGEIYARAEGNPFYTIELSRLVNDAGTLEDAVPGGVGDVIRRRLASLPPQTVELLTIGAVLGRDVPPTLLAGAAERNLDDVVDAIEPAVVQRLLVGVPDHPLVLRFSHALVRQVILDDLTPLRRARLHLKVADAIEAGGAGVDDAEVIAQHLWQAAPIGVSKRAAAALERAAEVALRRVSYHAAEDLLTKAVARLRAEGRAVTLDIWGSLEEGADYVNELRNATAGDEAIRWRGQYCGAGVWDALADLDVLAVPSRWIENSPNVILEAFAVKVPIVATRIGGIAELVEHDTNGLLFDINDVADLCRQIRRLLDEPDLLGRLSSEIAPVRTVDTEMELLVELYRHLIDGSTADSGSLRGFAQEDFC